MAYDRIVGSLFLKNRDWSEPLFTGRIAAVFAAPTFEVVVNLFTGKLQYLLLPSFEVTVNFKNGSSTHLYVSGIQVLV